MVRRLTMFLLPVVLVGVSRLGAEASKRLFPTQVGLAVALAVYYAAILAAVPWVRRATPEGRLFFLSGARPAAWRVGLCVVLPALPLLVFLLGRLAPVSPAVVGGIVFFAALNASLEEVFWRGVMARLAASDAVRILYPAAIFSLAHWFNMGTYLPLSPRTMAVMVLSTFTLGVLWMWFYLRERGLLWVISSHFAIDLFALLAFAMSAPRR